MHDTAMMRICDWPTQERPREKLLQRGSDALSDAELLAIFLRTGARGKTALDLSRELLNEFGSLRALLHSSESDFCAHMGLGPAKYVQMKAILGISQRYLSETLQRQRDVLVNPSATEQYLLARLRDKPQEIFAALFLDNHNQVICFEELFYGTVDHTFVYVREVVKRAIHHSASKIIVAHNHPSGHAEPSQADRECTDRLKKGLDLLDIQLIDHFVIGDGIATSFATQGLL